MTAHPAVIFLPTGLCVILAIALAVVARQIRNVGEASPAEHLIKIQNTLEQINTVFTVPYLRGGFGETLLEELLSNWLPERLFAMQYSFESGERADAVIFLGDHKIAVDAKFPLQSIQSALDTEPENSLMPAPVKRSFQNHIKSIASKYIRPAEGTLQFALMYIPSEKIYYHIFVAGGSDLMQEALENNVVPVSPSSLFLYVQTVAYGLKGLALPTEQKEFARKILQIKKEFDALIRSLSVSGTHLKNLVKSYEESQNRMSRLGYALENPVSGEEPQDRSQH